MIVAGAALPLLGKYIDIDFTAVAIVGGLIYMQEKMEQTQPTDEIAMATTVIIEDVDDPFFDDGQYWSGEEVREVELERESFIDMIR